MIGNAFGVISCAQTCKRTLRINKIGLLFKQMILGVCNFSWNLMQVNYDRRYSDVFGSVYVSNWLV